MKQSATVEGFILTAHDRLCGAISARSAVAIQAQFCADEVDIWGLESGDGAHSATAVRTWAARLQAQPHRVLFDWTERTVMVADDVAWLSARGTMSLAGSAFVERRPFQMFGVLLAMRGRWLWRILDAAEPSGSRDGDAVPSGALR